MILAVPCFQGAREPRVTQSIEALPALYRLYVEHHRRVAPARLALRGGVEVQHVALASLHRTQLHSQ
jgi:hypothetical protein